MALRAQDFRAMEQAEAEQEFREAQAEASFSKEVLRRQIDWQHYAHEGKLSSKEVNIILGYDQQSAQAQADYLDEFGVPLAAVLLKVLATVANIETVEYTVVLIDQLLSPERSPDQVRTATEYFLDHARANPAVDTLAPLLQLLTTQGQHNPFTFLRVQHILATVLAAAYSGASSSNTPLPSGLDEKPLRVTVGHFLRYLISRLSTLSSSSLVPLAVSSSPYSSPVSSAAAGRELLSCLSSLKTLLRASPRLQDLFAELDGVRTISQLLLKDTQNAQLLYLIGFNVWILSYQRSTAARLREAGVLRRLVQVVKGNVMEKVIRICFSALRNFLSHSGESFAEDMIAYGLLSVLETLSKRKFKDADILNDMQTLTDALNDTVRHMSTFEKYSAEVQSGELSWANPAHKNEIFWRENINQFDATNFTLVQRLVQLAEPTGVAPPSPVIAEREETVREVACFDLGEFARFHPEGKKILHKLGGKDVLMRGLADKSSRVSKAALLATQKLMVANWEFLAKSSSGGVASIVSSAKKN